MATKVQLVVIDPQNDFCDPTGSLYVKGADQDMIRLAKFVKKFATKFDDISVTLDSHHDLDIAHPAFWRDSQGKNPTPFTVISAADVDNGTWIPAIPAKSIRDKAIKYVKALAAGGRYPLVIWPVHCVIGSWGQNIYPAFHKEIRDWGVNQFATVNYVTKGSNQFTEHYSAVKAEVPDPNDSSTQINTEFIKRLLDADDVLISGEALSHCVANTFRDVADAFGNDEYVKKLVLLTDTSSNVTGFDKLGDDFIKDMTARGMRVSTTTDYIA